MSATAGTGQNPLFPRIFGQEAAGVGEGVTELKPGDHVLPVFTGECKECAHYSPLMANPFTILLGLPPSVSTPWFMLVILPRSNPLAPLDKVCVLICGISTGLGATLNVAKPTKSSTVAVFGLGAVGLAAAEGARIARASRIIGVDVDPSRFEEGNYGDTTSHSKVIELQIALLLRFFYSTFPSRKFGVTEFVNPEDHKKPVQVLMEMTNGGVDRSAECNGNIDAMISAFECVHDGWEVAVLVGVPHKDAVFKTRPINVLNERILKGTFFGNHKLHTDLPLVVEKYMNKELELEKLITHSTTFSEMNKAFEYMLKGESLRCTIPMEE
ncbi:hypothetical protein SLEP1_g39796 [Rubroshorea leprosula]|uniref:alcohol dehydrogenase n=1 Tax=Rubroshorea leprosula TaxID=152421 RepID=A0AAV5L1Q5_9ROSI|nr:hypothetical protein SLEP1_g39796 [Rubroshorea leprosula]